MSLSDYPTEDAVALCTFCEEAGHLNDAEIWIIYELALLTSVIEGDAIADSLKNRSK